MYVLAIYVTIFACFTALPIKEFKTQLFFSLTFRKPSVSLPQGSKESELSIKGKESSGQFQGEEPKGTLDSRRDFPIKECQRRLQRAAVQTQRQW